MIFNSLEFLVFFPTVVIGYFLMPHKYRWVLLLLASYYFYMAWKPEYVVIILFSTIINYLFGIVIEKEPLLNKRKIYLGSVLLINLGILFIFKYLNFMTESINQVFEWSAIDYSIPISTLLLPMGISFYTFQTISYIIDIYRGTIKAEKHLGIFALYVVFFPQLVAGPIERSERLLPQFYQKHKYNHADVTWGLKRMAWGFFKKLVIADRISVIVNTVYDNPTNFEGVALIVATLSFGIQIYCDFSGYSDIAIGAARVLGINLMENFNRPYFSKSISEFWKRWHISLSSWFKDYLYIPLGGNRVKVSRAYLNLFITFLVSGLWHGASWTFVIWGSLHGIYLIFGKVLKPLRETFIKLFSLNKVPRLHNMLSMCVTNSLVMFAWIFFRANTVSDALYIIKNLFNNSGNSFSPVNAYYTVFNLGLYSIDVNVIVVSVFFLFLYSLLERKSDLFTRVGKKPKFIRFSFYTVLLLYLIFFSYIGSSEFIYFQF